MPNSPICRTKGVTISIFNKVVIVMLGVLVDAKSHDEVALYNPHIRKWYTLSHPAEPIMTTAACCLPSLNE
jgi:hypothetical protein